MSTTETIISEEAVIAATELTEHVAACKAEVLKAIDGIRSIDLKADEAKLARIYKNSGLMSWFAKYFEAGGKPGQIADVKADRYAYDLVSNLKRVHGRFGADRPARFTCWSAIVKAVSLDDATLESVDVTVQTAIVAAVAAKSDKVATVSDKSETTIETKLDATPTVRETLGHVVASPSFRDIETQQHFAGLANELAAHLQSGGAIDPAVWASLKVSLNLILG